MRSNGLSWSLFQETGFVFLKTLREERLVIVRGQDSRTGLQQFVPRGCFWRGEAQGSSAESLGLK